MLYTLNLDSDVCQLFFHKSGKQIVFKSIFYTLTLKMVLIPILTLVNIPVYTFSANGRFYPLHWMTSLYDINFFGIRDLPKNQIESTHTLWILSPRKSYAHNHIQHILRRFHPHKLLNLTLNTSVYCKSASRFPSAVALQRLFYPCVSHCVSIHPSEYWCLLSWSYESTGYYVSNSKFWPLGKLWKRSSKLGVKGSI